MLASSSRLFPHVDLAPVMELFRDFRILYYREGRFAEGEKEIYRAGLFGQKVR